MRRLACTRPLASLSRIHVAAMLPAAISSQAVTSADTKASQKNRILKPALAAPGIRYRRHPISAGEGKDSPLQVLDTFRRSRDWQITWVCDISEYITCYRHCSSYRRASALGAWTINTRRLQKSLNPCYAEGQLFLPSRLQDSRMMFAMNIGIEGIGLLAMSKPESLLLSQRHSCPLSPRYS